MMVTSLFGASSASAAPANFIGHWNATTGGWTVLTQDASGGCTGTSDFSGYGFTNCHVSGSEYSFDVTLGDDYTSHNSGTITGNTLAGSFTDTNGTTESYTGSRDGGDATATTLTCPASSTGVFTCTATVTDTDTPSTVPTGSVALATTGGTIDPSCVLSSGTCLVTYTPDTKSNQQTTTITAAYTSDSTLTGSSTQTDIAPVQVTTTHKTVNTYIAFAQNAIFTVKLSRPSNLPVAVWATTADGTGTHAAKAHDADYKRVNTKLTVPAGHTSTSMKVTVFPREDIRVDSDFQMNYTQLTGATFASATKTAGGAMRLDDGRPPYILYVGKAHVEETIDPHMLAGTVEEAVDITDHKKAPRLWVRRWNSKTFVSLERGTKLYIGDEIMTHKNTVAALHFIIGGEVGINRGTRATVVSQRSVREGDGGVLSIIGHQIHIWENISHEKSQKLLIQTNGGVMGIKG